MGVTIDYYTKSDVPHDDIKAIVAATREPDNQPWLLCEPISFLDMPGYEGRLFGASKLNLMPDPAEKAEAEHCDTDRNDLQFLLDKLCEISARFDVDWIIQIEGAEIGTIDNGVCDPTVRDAIEAMAGLADGLGELGDFM